MGQKVNPHGARVGVILDWSTKWYAGKKDFSNNLIEDYNLRKSLKKKLDAAGISHIDIQRTASRLHISIYTAKPGVVIGKAGAGVESLKKELENETGKQVNLDIIEIKNPDARPAIAGPVPDMADYDVLFVGFPIWWGRHPSVVDTFLEALDLAGKTVVPFATSGESEIGESGAIMQKVVPAAKVAVGKRFPNDVTEEELKAFAEDYL